MQVASVLASLLVLGLALWALRHALGEYGYQDVARELRALKSSQLFLAGGITVVAYLTLLGYDALAVRYAGHPLPLRKTSLASFLAYAVGHNTGFASVGTTSVRYRLYSAWGLSTGEIARIVLFCSVTFWVGFLTFGSFVFLLDPLPIPPVAHLPFATVRPIGGILLAILLAYVGVCLRRRTPFRYRSYRLSLPTPKMIGAQMAVGSLDWFASGTALYFLLPSGTGFSLFPFFAIYLLAQVVGVLSHVPGGLGVLETIIVYFVSSANVPASAVLGSVLVFRVIYYLFPLLLALGALAFFEIRGGSGIVRGLAQARPSNEKGINITNG
jgi:phosphatidylglycerol lysyltransferase